MTTTFKHEAHTGPTGTVLVVEQYAEKPHFIKFWRWSINGVYGGVMLKNKPNIKRLKEKYL